MERMRTTNGTRIAELRIARGLSQRRLAAVVEVSPTQIGRYEQNVNDPTLLVALRIADALECSVHDFVTDGAA